MVKCTDCINYDNQLRCFMEDCIWSPGGYCAPCGCNNCDNNCMEPEMEKALKDRPKYEKSINNKAF